MFGEKRHTRLVHAVFDDENPETVDNWAYPDTGEWDPERNVSEFLGAMPTWRKHGLRAIATTLQCGSPEEYSESQPWTVSAYRPDGTLKPDWTDRLERVLDRADELGMAVILGLFYFGQDDVLADEASVIRAVDAVLAWLHEREYTNVVIEDDHFRFGSESNMLAALESGASWGYFDPGENDYRHGYQSPPVRWDPNTARKRAFFAYLDGVTDPEGR